VVIPQHGASSAGELVRRHLIYAGFNLVAALISYPAGYRFGRKGVLLMSFLIFRSPETSC